MIGISFWRVLRSALQNFWRNIWITIATAVIMTVTLLMMTFLYFANVFGAHALENIQGKVDLLVTFKENVQEQYIEAVAQEIRGREDVREVRVETSEQALENFLATHEGETLIEDSLQELGDNPLPAHLYIGATEPRFYETIARHLESEKFAPFIEEVNFENSRPVFDKLSEFIGSVQNVALFITVVFAVLVILIMFNTIRLAIYSFREEIDIMRLVGASRWFIQGPFIIEAILVASVAILLTNLITYPALNSLAPSLQRYFFDTQTAPLDLYQYAVTNWLTILGLQILLGVGLATFSSLIAVRRYLKD